MLKTSWLAGCRTCVVLLLGSSPMACLGQGGDPNGERNQASGHLLPEGLGLAASLPAGASMDQHPEVIFNEDF